MIQCKNKPELKYLYRLYIWGGFFNKEHKEKHKVESGEYIFNSEKQRNDFLQHLQKIEKEMKAHMLAFDMSEGFVCKVNTILHRVTLNKKTQEYIYTSTDINVRYNTNSDYSAPSYHMTWKWHPGFNDYPFGEDFDYEDTDSYEVIEEWITGAFHENLEK